MEEEKAAAYYDELTRKGGGAARFKQGLGFSSTTTSSNDAVPSRGSALPSASSFLSSFVRASSPSKTAELEKQAQLQSIQNKLRKKPNGDEIKVRNQSENENYLSSSFSRVSRDRDNDRHSNRGNRSRSRDRHRSSRHRSRSRSRDKVRISKRRSRSGDRNSRRRSRSRSRDRSSRRRSRSREDYRSRRRDKSRSRSRERERSKRKRSGTPPRDRKGEKGGKDNGKKDRNEVIDYAKLIEGYDKMTPAERVKAKMKLQLSETAEEDPNKGMGSGWERFEFDKDAPLDDEEIEAVEDDAALVKHIGQSFRFSAVEAKREEQIKAAHDEAMFGAPSLPPPPETDEEDKEDSGKETNDSAPVTNLISDQVFSMQQGSWRDRVRKT